jgi:voltage-gated potassium channel Kch
MSEAIEDRAGGIAALGAYVRRRYEILFYSLLLTMGAAPLLESMGFSGNLIELFLASNLLAAVIPIDRRSGRRLLLVILLSVALIMRLGAGWLNQATLSAASLMIWTILALLAAAGALSFALRAQSIKREHVYAVLSTYLLAGVFFGNFYWTLEQVRPGTFTFAGDFSRTSAMYFSFVTLATVGYGDIVPRTDIARGLATVEGVGGQLFLAVLIARLSLYVRGNEAN